MQSKATPHRNRARCAGALAALLVALACTPPPAPAPTTAPAPPAAPASPAAAPASPAATPRAQPRTPVAQAVAPPARSAAPPKADLDLTHDLVNPGEPFTVRLQAASDDGVASMWWWASGVDDDSLRDTHAVDCLGATPCRKSWSASTNAEGGMVIHALARDRAGQQSDESKRDVRVR
jgi:hypothetical protein